MELVIGKTIRNFETWRYNHFRNTQNGKGREIHGNSVNVKKNHTMNPKQVLSKLSFNKQELTSWKRICISDVLLQTSSLNIVFMKKYKVLFIYFLSNFVLRHVTR